MPGSGWPTGCSASWGPCSWGARRSPRNAWSTPVVHPRGIRCDRQHGPGGRDSSRPREARWAAGDLSVGSQPAFLLMIAVLLAAGAGNLFDPLHVVVDGPWGQSQRQRFWGGPALLYHPNIPRGNRDVRGHPDRLRPAVRHLAAARRHSDGRLRGLHHQFADRFPRPPAPPPRPTPGCCGGRPTPRPGFPLADTAARSQDYRGTPTGGGSGSRVPCRSSCWPWFSSHRMAGDSS